MVYVSTGGGSDIYGDGSILKPYQTIAKANSSITDASRYKRYVMYIEPGNYIENVTLKPHIYLWGAFPIAVRIEGNIDINDPGWAVNDDQRSGMENLTIVGSGNFDFTHGVGSPQGKLQFYLVNFDSDVTVNGFSNINQLWMESSVSFADLYLYGINTLLNAVDFTDGGTLLFDSSVNALGICQCNGCYLGTVTANDTHHLGTVGSIINSRYSSVTGDGVGSVARQTQVFTSSLPTLTANTPTLVTWTVPYPTTNYTVLVNSLESTHPSYYSFSSPTTTSVTITSSVTLTSYNLTIFYYGTDGITSHVSEP